MNRTLYVILLSIFVLFGISSAVFTFQKCGAKAFFLGNGGFYAAISGMCDE